jgi:hypothetical protein
MQTKHTAENTEASAVKVTRNFKATKELIYHYSHFSPNYKKIINILDDIDVVRALGILSAATHLFKMKYEEIKNESSK